MLNGHLANALDRQLKCFCPRDAIDYQLSPLEEDDSSPDLQPCDAGQQG